MILFLLHKNIEEDEKEKDNLAPKHPELIEKLNGIVKREHWQPTINEWEFIFPKIKLSDDVQLISN